MEMRKLVSRIALPVLGLLFALPALADAERVALVIGNASYEVGRLANPGNDADDIAAALRALEFDVTVARDLGREGMLEHLDAFRSKIAPGGIALVFYAGHAMELDGHNWLLPVDNRRLGTQAQVRIHSVSAQDILNTLEEAGARLNVLILDACRDNPLPAGARSAKRGLGAISTGTSTLVAFSTAPGRTADDGSGRNSPYTAALLHALRQPQVAIPDLFNQAGAELVRSTGGRQIPWKSETPIWPAIALRGAAGETPVAASPVDRDSLYWSGSGCAEDRTDGCRRYLDAFPQGFYAELARAHLQPVPASKPVASPLAQEPVRMSDEALGMLFGMVANPAASQAGSARVDANGFVDRGNGVLLDTQTGLEWTQRDNGKDINWNNAMHYCSNLSTVGGGWRLPSINELTLIYDRPGGGTTACGKFMRVKEWICEVSPAFRLSGPGFWGNMQNGSSKAWRLAFVDGSRLLYGVSFNDYTRALCVRPSS